MSFLGSLRHFFRRTIRRIRRHLSRKELIIISSFVVGVIIATAVIIVLKINAPKTPEGDQTLDISVAADNEETDPAAASNSEEITIVETATAETKVESTEATTVLAKKDDAKKGYMNRCVFLGDSRTVAMVNYGLINDDAALAQIGISHPSFKNNTFINNAGHEYTLKSYLASHQAPVIYIALGVNGINDPSEDHYKNTFIDLIDTVGSLSPNSNIVLMSIGPVNDNGMYKKTVQNSWINKYNSFLLDTAKEKHIFYLDISEILTGSDGQVKPEYNGGDGLHYSGSGCEAIFNYIVEHPVPGISDDGDYVVKYIKPNPKNTKVTMDDGSGIDEAKLQELMNMMMEEPTSTPTPTPTPTVTAEPKKSEEDEEEKKAREEEEARKRKEKEEREAEERRKQQEQAQQQNQNNDSNSGNNNNNTENNNPEPENNNPEPENPNPNPETPEPEPENPEPAPETPDPETVESSTPATTDTQSSDG